MQYLYKEEAKEPRVEIKGDEYRYLFRVRRAKVEDTIHLRNLQDKNLYSYKVVSINRREATLELISSQELIIEPTRVLKIGWCLIDPKNIEKTLPFLNEIGVAEISFIYCERSQKSYRLDLKRLEKILINSSQQSGRSSIIKLEILDSLDSFLERDSQAYLLDFSENYLKRESFLDINSFVVGCEGGFTAIEREKFEKRVVGFDSKSVLQSHTAVVSLASILLL